jgi:hypothetical protein
MEYASWLAGERWSDHPECTHPAVAALARLVNDCSSDAARSELVTLIPSVVGLTGDGRRTSLVVAMRATAAALPVVSSGRQRALAAGAMRCLPLVADDDRWVADLVVVALSDVPDAKKWAADFVVELGPVDQRLVDRMCDAIIRTAVIGIAEACVNDPDARLRNLLESAIDDFTPRSAMNAPASLVTAR